MLDNLAIVLAKTDCAMSLLIGVMGLLTTHPLR